MPNQSPPADQAVARGQEIQRIEELEKLLSSYRLLLATARGHNGANVNTGEHPIHPWYGPCDGMEDGGACSECVKAWRALQEERDALHDDAGIFSVMLDSAREDAAHWKAAWEKAARALSQIADTAREGLMQIEATPSARKGAGG